MTQSRGGRKAASTSVPVAKAEVQKVETKPVEAKVETVPVAKAEVQADLLPQEAAPIVQDALLFVQDESTLDLSGAAGDAEMQSDLADLAVGAPTYNITPLTVVVRSNYRHDIFEPQSRVNLASGQEVVIECESADIKARVVRNINQLSALKRQPDALVIIHG